MAGNDRRSERNEKQRVRSKVDRDARRDEGRPSHGDLARALLDIALTRYLRQGRDDDLLRFMDQVARRLEKVGFKPELTEQVWLNLQDSYVAGRRTLLRQRRTVAELDSQRDGSNRSCGAKSPPRLTPPPEPAPDAQMQTAFTRTGCILPITSPNGVCSESDSNPAKGDSARSARRVRQNLPADCC